MTDPCWPPERVGELLVELSTRAGLVPNALSFEAAPKDPEVGPWLERRARQLGIEAEPVKGSTRELEALLRGGGPAILRVGRGPETRYLAVLDGGRRTRLLDPELSVVRHEPAALAEQVLCASGARWVADVERMLEAVGVPPGRRSATRRELFRDQSGVRPVELGWLLRLPVGVAPLRHARGVGLGRRALLVVLLHLVVELATVGAWVLVGRGVLDGRLDAGWISGWALLLLSTAPLLALHTWHQANLAVDLGTLLRQRLFEGVLKLDPQETRIQGIGITMGQVIEADAVETLGTSGGLLAVLCVLELLLAVAVLSSGAGGWPHALLLVVWVVGGLGAAAAYHRRRRAWTARRFAMTHTLVETMVGHRTRLAQEPMARWHGAEDAALSSYLADSHDLDSALSRLTVLLPSGWLVVGIAAVLPVSIAGDVPVARLAVALGGVLMAWGSLRTLVAGLTRLSGAALALEQVHHLLAAASRSEPGPISAHIDQRGAPGPRDEDPDDVPLLEGRALDYGHPGRTRPVITGLDLCIRRGERVLLEGPSGGGKSTLGGLLAGLRRPDGGILLLDGVDLGALGAEHWRRRVVTVPQFHENHVFGATLAFNLLMGRRWPAEPADLVQAEEVCRELGLGPLLDRMPAGLLQVVGETGWQLSHGERSRVFIARALLQDADLLILDESVAALDPENLDRALRAVLARPSALMVIAHP